MFEKTGKIYSYLKPGKAVPTQLTNFNVLQQAYETELCPLCGLQMKEG